MEKPNGVFPDSAPGLEVDTPSRVYRVTGERWAGSPRGEPPPIAHGPPAGPCLRSEYETREWAWAVDGILNYLRKSGDGDGEVLFPSPLAWLLLDPHGTGPLFSSR